jgi:hypothetical protein
MTSRTLALAGLLILAALTRLLPHPANFAPITAIAVFGAIRFGNRWAALAVPVLALFLTDLVKELLFWNGLSVEPGLYGGMWAVYAATVLVAVMSGLARGTRSPVVIAAATVAGSCLFFVTTNWAYWAFGTFYPRTAEGLVACFVAAIPFFGTSLLGDFTYAVALFGGWALAEACFPALRPAGSPQPMRRPTVEQARD